MVIEGDSQSQKLDENSVRLLRRSLPALWFLTIFFAILSALLLMMFIFQVQHRDEFGIPFRLQYGSWTHLFGHLLKATVSGILAHSLGRLLLAVYGCIAGSRASTQLLLAIGRWWNSLTFAAISLVLYGLWVVLISGPLIESRSLSPLYRGVRKAEVAVQFELRLAEEYPAEGLIETTLPAFSKAAAPRVIYLHPDPLVTNVDITEARVVEGEFGDALIDIQFDPKVHDKIEKATANHRDLPLAIMFDGKVIQAPILKWPLRSGAEINGDFTLEEAQRIARGISGQK